MEERHSRRHERERERIEIRERWLEIWHEVATSPDSAFSPDNEFRTARNLWHAMRHADDDDQTSGWNRTFIEDHFGKETADRLRLTLMKFWRENPPTLRSERPQEERNTYFTHWLLGLAGIYAEAEDPGWADELDHKLAVIAWRYALINLNGLPPWAENLSKVHPDAADAILGRELSWELGQEFESRGDSRLLQAICFAPASIARLCSCRLRIWLDERGDMAGDGNVLADPPSRLRQVIYVLLKPHDTEVREYIRTIARQRLQDELPSELGFVWLQALIRVDPERGIGALEDRLHAIKPAAGGVAATCIAALFRDARSDSVHLDVEAFTPQLLLRLARLVHHHVRLDDDVTHVGVFNPDDRTHAEWVRKEITQALLRTEGEEGWTAKMEFADDPACAGIRNWFVAVAAENRDLEIDSEVFSYNQAAMLDKLGEAPASTNHAMFSIMNDRLDDLEDTLTQDASPRELWASIAEEKLMRREVARELDRSASGMYKVDQEAVTVDENRTDIRLRSTVSDHEATIELKIADKWSGLELRDAIEHQLVRRYMKSKFSRSGCLLLTLTKGSRTWKHPDGGNTLGPAELLKMLLNEARLVECDKGSVRLTVRILDLRRPTDGKM